MSVETHLLGNDDARDIARAARGIEERLGGTCPRIGDQVRHALVSGLLGQGSLAEVVTSALYLRSKRGIHVEMGTALGLWIALSGGMPETYGRAGQNMAVLWLAGGQRTGERLVGAGGQPTAWESIALEAIALGWDLVCAQVRAEAAEEAEIQAWAALDAASEGAVARAQSAFEADPSPANRQRVRLASALTDLRTLHVPGTLEDWARDLARLGEAEIPPLLYAVQRAWGERLLVHEEVQTLRAALAALTRPLPPQEAEPEIVRRFEEDETVDA